MFDYSITTPNKFPTQYGQLRSTALLRDNHQLSVKEPSLLGNLARLNTLVLDIASLSQHDGAVVEVSDAWAGGRRLRGANDSADDLRSSVVWQYLCRALALCNSAFVGLDTSDVPLTAQHNSLNIIDRALVRFLRDESETTSIEELRRAHERLFQTGVEAGEPRLQVSVHEDEQSYLLLMRGPVESVLARCSTLVVDDAELDLSEQYRIEAHKAYQRLAQDGSAVIGEWWGKFIGCWRNKHVCFCLHVQRLPNWSCPRTSISGIRSIRLR